MLRWNDIQYNISPTYEPTCHSGKLSDTSPVYRAYSYNYLGEYKKNLEQQTPLEVVMLGCDCSTYSYRYYSASAGARKGELG